jgi:uncharacterized membrane protein
MSQTPPLPPGEDPPEPQGPRAPEDVQASILFDIAEAVRLTPKLLPEPFGPGGRYVLHELVGAGRDSHVYRAVDTQLSKPGRDAEVAIKIRGPGAEARTEALVGRSVQHEHVVRVIDYGVSDDGEPFIVQEWIGGGELGDLDTPLPARHAVRLARQIASGVQALHSAGNIHGDLKPANVLLSPEGSPRVSDFDLASAADLNAFREGGNIAFMAPEMARGDRRLPSPVGDVYAIGGLLYMLLTGELPHGDNARTILERHRRGEEPEAPPADRDLRAICRRALASDPQRRYQSAEALAADLDRWERRLPILWTRPSPWRRLRLLWRRRPLPFAAALVLVIAACAVAIVASVMANQRQEAERLASEETERKNAANRKLIEQFVSQGWAGTRNQRGPEVFASLVWVDYLARMPFFGDDGPAISAREHISALTDLRHSLRAERKAGTLLDQIAAYCIAHAAIRTGDEALAESQLADLRAGLLGGLGPEDDMTASIEGLETLLAHRRFVRAGDPEAEQTRARLRELAHRFRGYENRHSVAALIEQELSGERPDR